MKKIFLLVALCFGLVDLSSAQDKITLKMPVSDPNKYFTLAHYYGYKQVFKLDSAKIDANGEFVFKNTSETPWPAGMYVAMDGLGKFYDFVWSGTEKDIYIEFDTISFVKTIKFKNSPENEHMFKYRKALGNLSDKSKHIEESLKLEKDATKVAKIKADFSDEQKKFTNYMRELAAEKPSFFASTLIKANIDPTIPETIPMLPNGKPDSTYTYRMYKSQFLENLDFSEPKLIRTPFLESKLERYFNTLVLQTSDSLIKESDYVLNKARSNEEMYRYVLWYITNKYESTDIVGLDGVVIHLYENYYLKDATWIDENQRKRFSDRLAIIKPLKTGNVMPKMVLKNLEGKSEDLMNQKAKYTIVYFYSPTCSHCKDHAPHLVKFQDEFRSKGFEVWNISTDRNKSEVENFVKEFNMGRMKNLYDPEGNYDFITRFDVYSTPTLYILDKDKKIVAKRIPIEEISRFIEYYERNLMK